MSSAALRPCATPRCPTLVRAGHCAHHAQVNDLRRGNANQRGYTYRWSQFSKGWLCRFPICGMRADGALHAEHSKCVQQGRTVAAECTDHIDGHARPDDRETFFDEDRLQSLCSNCNRIKAIEHKG